MKRKIFLFTSLVLGGLLTGCGGETSSSSASTPAAPINDDKVHIIILTGQSGARGKALVKDLTEEQKEPNPEVEIMQAGLKMEQLVDIPNGIDDTLTLSMLEPGMGDLKTEFGPELGLGEAMFGRYELGDEIHKAVIIKYSACGSTFTDHWYSSSSIEDASVNAKLDLKQVRTNEKTNKQTGPLTNNLYQIIDATISQLEEEGCEYVFDGAAFIHGEQDAKFDDNMEIYKSALNYFISDLRDYIGVDDLPFVITEALTNSAKYSNTLRTIQKEVANETENCYLVTNEDLYTNTFEPWHFGAQSNFELGNRIGAELFALNDTRIVESFQETKIDVPYQVDVQLPKYLKANFSNGRSGLVKVNYTSQYDKNVKGEQDIAYTYTTSQGTFSGGLTVNVTDAPYVDGIGNDYASIKKNPIGDKGDFYVYPGDEGIFFGFDSKDKTIFTDGEAWGVGDMGQSGKNDDLRIFLTTSTAEQRYSICLSSANLFRVYGPGSEIGSLNKNLIFKKIMTNYKYRTTVKGLLNTIDSADGAFYECYIAYEDLGIDDYNDIKLCVDYNDISIDSDEKKVSKDYYLAKNVETGTGDYENDINSYFSISELM